MTRETAAGSWWIRHGSSNLRAAEIVQACDASLARLRTDRIDLYQIHWPNRNVPTFGALYFDPRHDGWLYMTLTEEAPGAGLWHSRDHGQSWRAVDALPFSNVQRVEFDPSGAADIYVSTFGGSVWRGPAAA